MKKKIISKHYADKSYGVLKSKWYGGSPDPDYQEVEVLGSTLDYPSYTLVKFSDGSKKVLPKTEIFIKRDL